MLHELKTWPEFFEATMQDKKKFELRRNDRPEGFKVGDRLLLREYIPNSSAHQNPGYTGRQVLVSVDYVMDSLTLDRLMDNPNRGIGLSGYVIMSISKI